MGKHALNARCSDIFAIGPNEDRVLVTMITDPEHPEFDERALLPVDEELAWAIRRLGQLQPARGYVAGTNEAGQQVVVLTIGRQRWKAIQHVWQQMREEGLDDAMFPAFGLLVTNARGVSARREERIVENLHRREVEGIALARDVRAHLDIVGEDDEAVEEARRLFNFKSTAALRNCLALLSTTPAVQELLEDGTITPTGGLHLSRQPEDVQDQVAERLSGDDDGDDEDQSNEGGDTSSDRGAIPPRPASVSEVRQAINDVTGKQTFAMVSVKQVEKQIEKQEAALDKAYTKLEEALDGPKQADAAARVSKLLGYIEGLRWARGETSTTSAGAPSQGNDKMTAAWDSLWCALVDAKWPTPMSQKEAGFPTWSNTECREIPEYNAVYQERIREARERILDSHSLFVAGEFVARRDVDDRGVTTSVSVNVDSTWFQRLVDPHGTPSKLVRDWGAHGWLASQGKAAGHPRYKRSSQGKHGKVELIDLDKTHVGRMVRGTAIGTPMPVEELILRSVREHTCAVDVSLESRFGTPWTGDGSDDGEIGPDLQEDDSARESIVDALWGPFSLDIPREECGWATVGDFVADVERRLAAPADASDLPAVEVEQESGDHDDRKCPECGSANVSPFVARASEGQVTASGMVCDDCDTSFDLSEEDQAGQDGDE